MKKPERKIKAVRGLDGRWYASGVLNADLCVWRQLHIPRDADQQRADEEVVHLYPNA